MKVIINSTEYQLDNLLTVWRKIISIGRLVEEVNNSIGIEDERFDVFQCQITRSDAGAWLLHNGQYRTECPKGLRAARDRACGLCRGRCMNSRVANPTYSWRTPNSPTLLNGNAFDEYVELSDGDVIGVC